MGKIDYGADALKVGRLVTRMSRRIAELTAEVARLNKFLGLLDKRVKPSTKKILASATRAACITSPGPVADGSKVRVIGRRLPGAVMTKRQTSTSNYFGVSRHKPSGKWRAQVGRKDIKFNKIFDDELDAAIFVQEKLGNKAEVQRIKKLIAKRDGLSAMSETSKVDDRHETIAAAGIEEIKGAFTWKWSCNGCGETGDNCPTANCPKCNGRSFEKIKVLDDPLEQLARPEGWHNK